VQRPEGLGDLIVFQAAAPARRVGVSLSALFRRADSGVPYHEDMNAVEWERMGCDLRERAKRWEHPAAGPETDEDVAALDQLAEVLRAAMSGPLVAEASRRGAQ